MTTLPTMMATIAASIFATTALANQTADFNNDGNIDAMDLVALTSTLNSTCEGNCPTDLNEDGNIDTADLMILMGQWGPVPGWVPSDETEGPVFEEEDAPFERDPNRDMSWQNAAPVLLDAIYFDQYTELFHHGGYDRWHNAQEYNQGEHTMSWLSANDIAIQPMVYGGVDWNHDNILTEEDKDSFKAWVDATIPADYDGPLCLDLEGQWWSMLDSQSQTVMDVVINFYLENIEYAKELRPNAKIGFWGFPKKTHSNPEIETASIQRLLNACTAIFPDVYENNPRGNDSARLQLHLERCIEMVNGEIPVYAQVSPRYKKDSSGYRYFHTQDEFMRDQVKPALAASWTDADGKEHRVSSVSFWEAYVYVSMYTEGWSEMSLDDRKAEWDVLDFSHIEYLKNMNIAVIEAVEQLAEASEEEQTIESDASPTETVAIVNESSATQTSRFIGVVETLQPKVFTMVSGPSYKSSTQSYRAAKRSFSKAKRAFASAQRKYPKGSLRYAQALEDYLEAKEELKIASALLDDSKSKMKNARARMNYAKYQWKTNQDTGKVDAQLVASK